VLVATPIGNLGDCSPRALETLAGADRICCEDTRRTRRLLAHAGITGVTLVSVHEHNEAARTGEVLEAVVAGELVALVSDAGTPAISDPGVKVVAAAAAAGLTVSIIPGPNAAVAAVAVSGLPGDRFCFEGFLPRAGGQRRRRLEALAVEERTCVLHEAPTRLPATLADLEEACGGDRPVVVVRELTKLHEEIWRGTLREAAAALGARATEEGIRGEVVVVLGGAPAPDGAVPDQEIVDRLAPRLSAGAGLRDAATAVAAELGLGRRRVYQLGLGLRPGGNG
jgi:16S rRNA (cytidine1402-2'-O)-methyltransferase